MRTRPAVAGMTPPRYATYDASFLRLDQNTNPLVNLRLFEGLKDAAAGINAYGSPDADALCEDLATKHDVPREQVVAGNGADDLFDIAFKAFADPGDTVAMLSPTFEMFPFFATLHSVRPASVPLRDDLGLDVDALLATKAVLHLVPSPNNPTGNAFGLADLERLARDADGVVLIDEAYVEYADGDALDLVRRFENVGVVRTFSKAYGLAGLRVGYAIAAPAVARGLATAKSPYNVNSLSEEVARRALADPAFLRESVALVRRERERLAVELARRGLRVVPSQANFVFARLSFPAVQLFEGLLRQRVVVRVFSHLGMEDAVRISVGRPEENDRLLAAMDAFLEGER